MPEFHAAAPQAIVSEGLAQDHYVVARAGVEAMTLRTKSIDSTNAPRTPHLTIGPTLCAILAKNRLPLTRTESTIEIAQI